MKFLRISAIFLSYTTFTISCTAVISLGGHAASAKPLCVNIGKMLDTLYFSAVVSASGWSSLPFLQVQQNQFSLLAQTDTARSSTKVTEASEDYSKALTVLLAILLLPLGWGPTRKAVGLVNIIVGTILTVTGIGAIFGIPMILLGGVCLFI